MIDIKYGNGEGNEWSGTFGIVEAEITDEYKDKTIKEIADKLAQQAGIKHGSIVIHNLTFQAFKGKEKE
jgi:hypothetical protein